VLTEHLDALFRTALRLCQGHEADAEDLLQDTALRAFDSYGQLREPSAARSWLFTILSRTHLNRVRTRQRRAEMVRTDLDEPAFEAALADWAPVSSPADNVEAWSRQHSRGRWMGCLELRRDRVGRCGICPARVAHASIPEVPWLPAFARGGNSALRSAPARDARLWAPAMMTCGRAASPLADGGREATAEVVAARDSGAGAAVPAALDDMRRLSDCIREAVLRPGARECGTGCLGAIARARTDGSTRTPSDGIDRAAGVAVALLMGGTWLGLSLVPERVTPALDPIGVIAEDHLRSQRNTGLVSSDSLEVARWLADRLPFAVEVPIFPDAQLKGARLLLLNRQSGAVVDYMIDGRPLSYYVLPATEGDARSTSREVRVASRAGYRVAAWNDGGLTHALVAGLPGQKLIELAHYCITQMTAAVAVWARTPGHSMTPLTATG
jgi:hypothetical protein